MPILDDLRAALKSGPPHALDSLVESLARQGISESELTGLLEQLLLECRSRNPDDESEEGILGVMDRLTGWCHPSSRITTAMPSTSSSNRSNGFVHPHDRNTGLPQNR